MSSRSWLNIVVLIGVAFVQVWIFCVLFLTRQIEILMIGDVVACIFWAWYFWVYFLYKKRLEMVLSGGCLLFSLAFLILCMLDMLTDVDIHLAR